MTERTPAWNDPGPGWGSWRQAVARARRFPGDLPLRWNGQRALIIGHAATRRDLDHFIGGIALEDLVEQDFAWQEGCSTGSASRSGP